MLVSTLELCQKVLDRAKKDSFAGYDPFDFLNSKYFKASPLYKIVWCRIAWLQLGKRLPVNLRVLLAVPKMRNPKGIGLFILGLLEDYQRTRGTVFLENAIELGDWLLGQKCDQKVWKHACWGYHFDWNARAFFVPKDKPNIVTTVYIAQALFALGEQSGKKIYIETALDSADFIVDSLYTESNGRVFFAYIPGEDAFVHNASLWGAAWVAFVGARRKDECFMKLGLQVSRQSAAEQNIDGSWVYGARHHHQFIDGFHTGYNLEALHIIRKALRTEEFDDVIERGLLYYKTHLIEEDGTAKYYHNNRFPLDMHSVTQVVITLLKVGGSEEDILLAKKVVDKSINVLYMPRRKCFMYQKNRLYSNRIDYIRWTQAWVYYSFSYFNHVVASNNEKN